MRLDFIGPLDWP